MVKKLCFFLIFLNKITNVKPIYTIGKSIPFVSTTKNCSNDGDSGSGGGGGGAHGGGAHGCGNNSNFTKYANITCSSKIVDFIKKTTSITLLTLLQLCIMKPESCIKMLKDDNLKRRFSNSNNLWDLLKSVLSNDIKDIEGNLNNFISVYKNGSPDGTTWDDVIGLDNAVRDLQKILNITSSKDMIQNARRCGINTPRNILLVGPPGTGKTLLAKAASSAINSPLLLVSGAEMVKGKYAGIGVERVKTLFGFARKYANNSPNRISMIFIDEIDSCGRSRGDDSSSGINIDHGNTLNQLLVEMDGFNARDESEPIVIVIAATNRKDILDSALIRKGRFDNIIQIDPPNINGRFDLFSHYIKKQRKIAKAREISLKSNSFQKDILCQALDEEFNGENSNRTTLRVVTPIRATGVKIPATLFSNYTARLKNKDLKKLLYGMSSWNKISKIGKIRKLLSSNEELINFEVKYNGGYDSTETKKDFIENLASLSSGLAGADIASIVNDASIFAMENNRTFTTDDDYLTAIEDTILGKPIYSKDSSHPDPDWRIAIHESGHTLSSFILENVEPAFRASIKPRTGGSLGVTMFSMGEMKNLRATELRDRLVMMLAGKAAELHVFNGDSSTGASDDVNRAKQLAQSIVKLFAMDGIKYTISGDDADLAVKTELLNAEKRASYIVKKYEKTLYSLAKELMKKDTLNKDELTKIVSNSNKKTSKHPQNPKQVISNAIESMINIRNQNQMSNSEVKSLSLRRKHASVFILLILITNWNK
tara:strand:+ start:16216 stop:18516 length:2301 start_codon:yes stop_codon:yes gene_type:complete